ncbi:MAG: ABC transporter substrate-binding protein [SAR202 cluster bacterium]|nr:ABC transporter substrate-binding protein [SAR202 cluster bacterium]
MIAVNPLAPLPARPAIQRPVQPGPGTITVGLEGYDLSRPYPIPGQENEPAAKLLVENGAYTLPLWTKASYGGELRIPASYSPAMFDPFGFSHAGRPNWAGYGIQADKGRCSLQGRSEKGMATCDGKRAELYSHVLVPDVFLKWEVPDPLTYIFHIRKGVLWPAIPPMFRPDREVTADDVVWFFETQKERGVVGRDFYKLTNAWQPLDRYTVKVTLKSPLPDFLRMFSDRSQAIIPKECAEKADCANKNIIVSPGPFIITEVVPRQRILFTKNPEFHIPGVPWLDRMLWIQSTDAAANKAAFLTGQFDSYSAGGFSEAQALRKQKPDAQFQALVATSTGNYLKFRHEGPLADLRVRQALMRAVEFPTAWQAAAEGYMFMATFILYDMLGLTLPMGHAQAGINFQYDPQGAKKLLAEAGYPNGGFEVIIQTSATSGITYELDLALQQFWKKNLNVDTRIIALDAATHEASLAGKTWKGMWQGQIALGGGTTAVDGTMLWFITDSVQNFAGMSDPVMDEIYNKQRVEIDPVKRRDLLWQFMGRNLEQLWVFPLGHFLSYGFYQPWEMNVAGSANQYAFGSGSTWTHMFDLSKAAKR